MMNRAKPKRPLRNRRALGVRFVYNGRNKMA